MQKMIEELQKSNNVDFVFIFLLYYLSNKLYFILEKYIFCYFRWLDHSCHEYFVKLLFRNFKVAKLPDLKDCIHSFDLLRFDNWTATCSIRTHLGNCLFLHERYCFKKLLRIKSKLFSHMPKTTKDSWLFTIWCNSKIVWFLLCMSFEGRTDYFILKSSEKMLRTLFTWCAVPLF